MHMGLCIRTVGSVHAPNKNIENELSQTQRQVFSQSLNSLGLSSFLLFCFLVKVNVDQ